MFYKLDLETIPKVTEFYYVERNTTWRCADKNNILVFVTKGRAYFEINGKKTLIKEKQAVLIPAGTPYVRSAIKNELATFCYIHFYTQTPLEPLTEEELSVLASEIVESDVSYTLEHSDDPHPTQSAFLSDVFACDEHCLNQLEVIKSEDFKPSNPYRQLTASLTLGKLILRYSKNVIKEVNDGTLQKATAYPVPLQKALLYIQKNYRKKITTEILGEVAGVSVQHIIRLFKTHLNTTPLSYVNRYKIAYAMEMLRHGDISIKEISYELGFESPNYFSRLFKKQEKMSPSSRRGVIYNYDKEKK